MSTLCARCDAKQPAGVEWPRHTSGLTGASYLVCPGCEEGSAGKSVRAGDSAATDDQLRLFIERIERMEEEIREKRDDVRDTFSEMKAQGYDVKITRELLKLRRLSPNDRAERDALLDTYRAAIGLG